jgi:hypothetical protein
MKRILYGTGQGAAQWCQSVSALRCGADRGSRADVPSADFEKEARWFELQQLVASEQLFGALPGLLLPIRRASSSNEVPERPVHVIGPVMSRTQLDSPQQPTDALDWDRRRWGDLTLRKPKVLGAWATVIRREFAEPRMVTECDAAACVPAEPVSWAWYDAS